MKSFLPLNIAMKVMDNLSTENKMLMEYVDGYVGGFDNWKNFSDLGSATEQTI
ncbi:hypothetical protein ACWGXJ_25325 [Paenibacillus sp. S33]